eukprot:TRINITY_DN11856_c0_g1_i1.p1 TRINITY_DN11856_c0_g1~~TRINITY_DN11856_c0_g1_i1.p1  ORF type:complete len:437 (-),score=89.59 TRINITY_DN11856_c0_g1_i1:204-1514(-)
MKRSIAVALLLFAPCVVSGNKLRALGENQNQLRADSKVASKHTKNVYRQKLFNNGNVQYSGDFKIGGQEIKGIFDTGSFELVVRSSRCTACINPTVPYFHEKSKNYKDGEKMTRHLYGSGPCDTRLGYDTVSVGDNMVAEHQALWEIVQHNITIMNTGKFAAIVGIGPAYGFGNKEKTLLMNFDVGEFSICLDKRRNTEGYLTWGETKQDKVMTARVLGNHHWATRLRNVNFISGDKKKAGMFVNPCSDKTGCVAVIDSGTSLISAPRDALAALSAQIGEIKPDCSNVAELPNLQFELDGHVYSLPPQAYVMRVAGYVPEEPHGVWDYLFGTPKAKKVDSCMPAFMTSDMPSANGPVWIFGMPFFRYYHSTFDRENQVMKFAIAGEDCSPEPLEGTPKWGHKESLLSTKAALETPISHTPLDVQVADIMPPKYYNL